MESTIAWGGDTEDVYVRTSGTASPGALRAFTEFPSPADA
jgi:hypothetical protein